MPRSNERSERRLRIRGNRHRRGSYKGFEPTDNFHLYNDAEIACYKPYSWTDCEPTVNPETGEEWTAEEITALEEYYRDNYNAREHLARIIEDCEQAERFSVTDYE